MSDFEDIVVVEDDMSLPEVPAPGKGPASISYTTSHVAVNDDEQSPEVWRVTRKYPPIGGWLPDKAISLSTAEYVSVLEKHNSGWWRVRRFDHSATGWAPASFLVHAPGAVAPNAPVPSGPPIMPPPPSNSTLGAPLPMPPPPGPMPPGSIRNRGIGPPLPAMTSDYHGVLGVGGCVPPPMPSMPGSCIPPPPVGSMPPPPPPGMFDIPFHIKKKKKSKRPVRSYISDSDSDISSAPRRRTVYSWENVLDRLDWEDKHDSHVLRLAPFRQDVYVTMHPMTMTDLRQHLWLIKYAVPERWSYPPRELVDCTLINRVEEAYAMGSRALPPRALDYLPSVGEKIYPDRLNPAMPTMHAAAALLTEIETRLIYVCDCPDEADNKSEKTEKDDGNDDVYSVLTDPPCKKCTEQKEEQVKKLRKADLVYYVVMQMDTHTNVPAYKLIKTGTREAAASRIFYEAGAKGYSTVFVCAMRSDAEPIRCPDSAYEQVDDIFELIEPEEEGKIRVFF